MVSVIVSSCKVSYINTYQTYLKNNPEESLHYQDSIISVTFDVKPFGILFDIENLSEKNLYLIWDKSYFINPDGSTSKALNTDILETNSKIVEKENYESIIPQGQHFKRFSCSSKNLQYLSNYNSVSFYSSLTNSTISNATYDEFYKAGTYWYKGSKRDYASLKDVEILDKLEIKAVQHFIQNNNNLGIGFTINNKGKELEYHFKFPIKEVRISKMTSNQYEHRVAYKLLKENNFEPIKAE